MDPVSPGWHRGFMWTKGGFEVLHANWSAYPPGRGLEQALATLADFPPGTIFYGVDTIDALSPPGRPHGDR
jgi:hypothetical protein